MLDTTIMLDWDGTLADTILPTAVFFNDMFKRFNHNNNPLPEGNRQGIKSRFTGSSMKDFLTLNDFTEQECGEAYGIYKQVFGKDERYRCELFPGVKEILTRRSKGYRQQIVSANTKENILPILKINEIPPTIFEFIIGNEKLKRLHDSDKAKYIRFYRGHTQRLPDEITYIGDSPGDYYAAQEAEVNFIGVNYGWGEFEKNKGFPVVDSVQELEQVLSEI